MAWPNNARYKDFAAQQIIASDFLNEIQDQIVEINSQRWITMFPIYNSFKSVWTMSAMSIFTADDTEDFVVGCHVAHGYKIQKVAAVFKIGAAAGMDIQCTIKQCDFDPPAVYAADYDNTYTTTEAAGVLSAKVWTTTEFGSEIDIAKQGATVYLRFTGQDVGDIVYPCGVLIDPY